MTNREIDALIAEKVFGWKKNAVHPNLRGPGWWEDRPGSYTCEIPEFSTDPIASKQLRDKMRADGWQWAIRTATKNDFHCEIYKPPVTVETYFDSFGDTEEMSVALAALKALGVEVENV